MAVVWVKAMQVQPLSTIISQICFEIELRFLLSAE